MANTLGVYNPIFYAQEALIHLENSLGLASRVHRGYDAERRSFGLGETMNIRKPSTFTTQAAGSSALDVTTETKSVTLDQWREVKFKLTDKELAFSGERIISDHIRPAAYALANELDTKLSALYYYFPHVSDVTTAATSDITSARKIMRDNGVPLDPNNVHLMCSPKLEQGFLDLTAFSMQQGAGDKGVSTQMTGTLGTKYGFEVFGNQNATTHTPGVPSTTSGLAVNGAVAKGATSMIIDKGTVTGTLKAGDIVTVTTGSVDYNYSVTDTTATFATNAVTVNISPPARIAHADNDVVGLDAEGTKLTQSLAFHRNSMALVTAPLSEMGNELGAKIATVTDPITGLSLRSRLYYVGDSSEVHVALDLLYGVAVLDPDMGVRLRQA
jgi:hypothetical protein